MVFLKGNYMVSNIVMDIRLGHFICSYGVINPIGKQSVPNELAIVW